MTGIQATAAIVPAHYASEEQVARALARLGKPAAAALIQRKLPTTKAIRSGDLGEIYATEWIDAHSGYRAPIKRLRWKDHRNMAMRGDDVIGMILDPATPAPSLPKDGGEEPHRSARPDARRRRATGLDKDGGLPSPHALSFISAQADRSWALTRRLSTQSMRRSIGTASRPRASSIFSSLSPETRPQALLTAVATGLSRSDRTMGRRSARRRPCRLCRGRLRSGHRRCQLTLKRSSPPSRKRLRRAFAAGSLREARRAR